MNEFSEYVKKIIDTENGTGFWRNILKPGCQTFYKNNSFIIIKLINIEDTLCCYIYYAFKDNKKDFDSIYYTMLNYCLGNKVKFIYYKEKKKPRSIIPLLKEQGWRIEDGTQKYKYKFKCKYCNGECTCITNIACI